MKRAVHLHGRLAERFGVDPLILDVSTPGEVIQALCVLRKGFKDEIRTGAYRVVCRTGEAELELEQDLLAISLGRTEEFHIIPVVMGAKNSGIGKIILGVALVGAAFLLPGAAGLGATAFSIAGASVTYGNIAMIGVGLALSGASQILTPTAAQDYSDEKKDSSFLFSGIANTSQQGECVPIVVGRMRVGSVVISSGVSAERIAVGS